MISDTLKNLATEILSSDKSRNRFIKDVALKIARERKRLKENTKDLELMVTLLKYYFSGTYRHVPWKSLVSIVAACLYFLNPFDLVPDFVAVGLLDDLSVVAFVVRFVQQDLEQFKKFLEEDQ